MIVVHPAQLEATATRLTATGERLAAVARQLAGTGTEHVGHRGLARALDDVADDWRHGLDQLAQASAVTGAQLTEAARAYRAVDAAVARACG